jgi:hypothetical protein
MADDASRAESFNKVYAGVLAALLAFSASQHRAVSDDAARRLVWRLNRAVGRVRAERIREASRRCNRPRTVSFDEVTPESKPTSSKPQRSIPKQYKNWLPKLVRQAALLHGIGHPSVSEEVAATSAAKVTRASLTPDEKRAVDLLVGEKRLRSGDHDAERLAEIVKREWWAKRPVGRPPGVATLAQWDSEGEDYRVPLQPGEFLDVALPLLAEFAGVERLKISAPVLEVLAVLARAFGFKVRDEDVIDSFARLVRLHNRDNQ